MLGLLLASPFVQNVASLKSMPFDKNLGSPTVQESGGRSKEACASSITFVSG